jgi:DGQHR domain-containing protein
MLAVPVDTEEGVKKPGWIVDGQQRSAAIRDAEINEFPVFVTAFITDSVAEQKEQFILVNSTKPLPQGLIYELLPDTGIRLSSKYEKRKLSTSLLQYVLTDTNSPFFRAILTPTNSEGFIKDNSFLRMVENSLNDGVLYKFKTFKEQDSFCALCVTLLNSYWSAVKDVFRDAWGLRPEKSRLSHGVGIISLGYLMDAICDKYRSIEIPPVEVFKAELNILKPFCAWTCGAWKLGDNFLKPWNEVQNLSKDIELISNFILTKFKNN